MTPGRRLPDSCLLPGVLTLYARGRKRILIASWRIVEPAAALAPPLAIRYCQGAGGDDCMERGKP